MITSITTERVMPGRMSWPSGCVINLPSRLHDPGIRRCAFGDATLRVDQPGFAGALLARGLLGQYVRQQRDRFDVDALPADVRHGDNGNSFRRKLLEALQIIAARGDDQRRPGICRPETENPVAPHRG